MKLKTELNDVIFEGTYSIYTKMQVLVWCANGSSLLQIIEKNACDLLAKIIDWSSDKPVVVNFEGIKNIDDHSLENVFKSLGKSRTLIIVNGKHLYSKIEESKKGYKVNMSTTSEENGNLILIGKSTNLASSKIDEERKLLKDNFIANSVKSSFMKFDIPRRLHSTPILASGEYNSNLIISNLKQFIWISTFLSEKLQEVLDIHKPSNVKILTASLRAAPFAAMLGLFNNIPIETIDHFGPKHKVFNLDFLNRIEKDTNYIYVGDYSFGGTEIKIAKTYTEMKASKLRLALVIGNLIDSEHFKDQFNLYSLYNLNGANPEATFTLN